MPGTHHQLEGYLRPTLQACNEATRRLCNAISSNQSEKPARFVLVNTAGNCNRDLHEAVSRGQQCIIGLLRLLLPPHVDNEKAADYPRTKTGQNDVAIEWVAVRPDNLITDDDTWNRWKGQMPVNYKKG